VRIGFYRKINLEQSISHAAPHVKPVPYLNCNRRAREGARRGVIEWLTSRVTGSKVITVNPVSRTTLCQDTGLPALEVIDAGDDDHAVGANVYVVGIKGNIGCLDHMSGLTVVLANLLACPGGVVDKSSIRAQLLLVM
jgi:hypothetical protein